MDDIIKADVLAFAPELSTLTDQWWVDTLAFVNEFDFRLVDTEHTVRMVRILLCAHYGARAKRSGTGTAGPVISEAAGGVRRAYALVGATGGSLGDLGSTPYGLTLESILMSSGAHGPMVI